jgi:hypothetical protein
MVKKKKEKSLEEQTDILIDDALKILMQYNPKESARLSKLHTIELSPAYNKIIELGQLLLKNRNDYIERKFGDDKKDFSDYLLTYFMLDRLASHTNMMKYFSVFKR